MPIEKPPDQIKFWGDIADRDWFRKRADRAPQSSDLPMSREDLLSCAAKDVYGGIADGSDVDRFLTIARRMVPKAHSAEVYRSIDELAELFNLDFANLKAWLEWKGIVQRTRKPRV